MCSVWTRPIPAMGAFVWVLACPQGNIQTFLHASELATNHQQPLLPHPSHSLLLPPWCLSMMSAPLVRNHSLPLRAQQPLRAHPDGGDPAHAHLDKDDATKRTARAQSVDAAKGLGIAFDGLVSSCCLRVTLKEGRREGGRREAELAVTTSSSSVTPDGCRTARSASTAVVVAALDGTGPQLGRLSGRGVLCRSRVLTFPLEAAQADAPALVPSSVAALLPLCSCVVVLSQWRQLPHQHRPRLV